MSLKKLNLIFGWVVFAIAIVIYGVTMEKSASFWDCGEFIAAANKLQVVHPPGAPMYLMLGRLFSFFLPPDQVAIGVNFLSAFSTALAAMFIFWSTTILAKRVLNFKEEKGKTGEKIAIIGAGLIAALAFIFQDSQWFNAAEAEVYAVSTGLTAAVIYMALKWTEVSDKPNGDKWLLGIALIIGISIGVHLLNLLAIPVIALLYYFYKSKSITPKGIGIAFIVGAILLLFIQYGVILELPKLASGYEILFVNSLNLPFGSGLLFLLVLVFIIPLLLIFYASSNKEVFLYGAMGIIAFLAISEFFKIDTFSGSLIKAVLIASAATAIYFLRERKGAIYKMSFAFIFIMIGYLSYTMVPIRSAANPPIDIYNPDNVFGMLSYLSREQYGDRPLLKGPVYTSDPIETISAGKEYAKRDDKYVVIGDKVKYKFDASDEMLFPRAWDFREDRKKDAYKKWLKLGNKKPTFSDNLRFFFTYQLDFMYWRYFMWNFAGRQNSEQSHGSADVGNWESGIPFVDAGRTIQADVYPDSISNNPSVNHFFMLPFVLGIIGLILQWRFSRNDAIAIIALFLLTGVAIVIYLNQEPLQPRERDYAYVGSFMAYAIWIGLSIAGLYRASRSFEWKDITYVLTGFSVVFVALVVMGFGSNHLGTLFPIAIVLAIMIAAIYGIAILFKKLDNKTAAFALVLLGLLVPSLMGFVGWEDHNRNELHLARAVGANYLTSCNQNAILFTEGDNDTYPLWYAQEVEEVRPDIRIVNNSLLQADWYADQIQQRNSYQPGLELTFESKDYQSGTRDFVYLNESREEIALKDAIRFIKSDDPRTKIQTPDGAFDFFPAKTFSIPINKEEQLKNGLISEAEAEILVDTLLFRLPKDYLKKDEYIILDIIERNINKRPIYFTGENLPSILGLSHFTRREGSSIRLIPILNPAFGTEAYSAYDPPIEKDKTLAYFNEGMDWGNIDSGVYLEETGQRQVMRVFDYATLMMYEYAEAGDKEKAMATYAHLKNKIYASSVPKDSAYFIFKSTGIIESLLMIGENEEAYEIAKQTINSAFTQIEYINTANSNIENGNALGGEMIKVIQEVNDSALRYGNTEIAAYIENLLSQYE